MSTTQTIDVFLQWCSDNDIWLDPRLRIQCEPIGGITVYSKDAIAPPRSVVHIHRCSVLSIRSCSLSEYISPVLYGPEAQHALSLALYVEILAGKSSRWSGYLQSLPVGIVDLPIFWSRDIAGDRSHDGHEALEWLRGTEVERHMKRQRGSSLNALNDYYFNCAEPLLLRHFGLHNSISSSKPSLQGFYRAYSLVSSRAFLVDAYHGLSMVPVADAFNHEQDNHVHLQTEFSVCPDCGSLYECPHDQELHSHHGRKSPPPSIRAEILLRPEKDLDQYYEIVSNAQIQPHTEVFNTYGETLTNAQLLTQYGFMLDVNENDCVTWDLYDVYESLRTRTDGFDYEFRYITSIWNDVLQRAVQDRMFETAESQLVHFCPEGASDNLFLDGDGRISHQLWTFLALPLCLRGKQNGDLFSVFGALDDLLAYQGVLEIWSDRSNDGGSQAPLCKGNSATTVLHMVELAHSVTDLCLSRKAQVGKEGINPATHSDLGDMLDAIPADMTQTRLAISVVMGEQSMLDSCISAWTDIRINAV